MRKYCSMYKQNQPGVLNIERGGRTHWMTEDIALHYHLCYHAPQLTFESCTCSGDFLFVCLMPVMINLQSIRTINKKTGRSICPWSWLFETVMHMFLSLAGPWAVLHMPCDCRAIWWPPTPDPKLTRPKKIHQWIHQILSHLHIKVYSL